MDRAGQHWPIHERSYFSKFRAFSTPTAGPTLIDTIWQDQATTAVYQVNFTLLPAEVTDTTASAQINGWLVGQGQVFVSGGVVQVRTAPPWISNCIPAPSLARLQLNANGELEQRV